MEDTIAAFIEFIFSWRFRANSLKNSLRKIYTLGGIFCRFLEEESLLGHETGLEGCVHLGAVAILGEAVMWFWCVVVNQVALGQRSLES